MAIAATTVWELRTTGTASNVNGGGFNPSNTGNSGTHGTDYSQQDASQYSFADLAGTNANTATPTVTSVSHSFVGADCGNLIHINSGTSWTAGWYEILSVSGGAATLDRACASVASPTAGTYHVGGAMSDGSVAPFTTVAVGGNTAYIKAGTYTVAGATNWNWGVFSGTSALQCFIIGYNTVRGDNPTGSNRPQINFATGVFLTGAFTTWANLSFNSAHTAANEGTAFWSGGGGTAYNCKFVNTSTTANIACIGNSANSQFFGCEFVCYFGRCIQYNSYCAFVNCWFHDSPFGIHNNGVTLASLTIIGCTFSNCTTAALNAVSGSTWNVGIVMNCTFFGGVGTKSGIGINLLGSTDQHFSVYNSIFYGLTTGYLSAQTTGANYDDYNDYFNNTTDVSGLTKGPNSIALNPGFLGVGQYTGTTATSSSNTMTDSGANFANVVAGRDFLYVSAMTGGSGAGIYGITGKTTTTITTDNTLGSGSAITYSIIYGQNFAVGSNMRNVGSSNTGNTNTTTYVDIGAAQVNYTDPGIANVRSTTSYTFANASETGTSVVPSAANVRNGIIYDNGTSGTLVVPSAANVRLGVVFDNGTTGTIVIPANTDVRLGVVFDNGTVGTIVLPVPSTVLAGIVFDNGTVGTLAIPSASVVASAVWDTATNAHVTTGTFGYLMQQLLTLAQFLGLK